MNPRQESDLQHTSRFAPSPTGRLHLGHAFSAAIARASGSRFLVRIDDLDGGRCRPEFVAAIFEDLAWLGVTRDEPPLVQSARTSVYASGLEQIQALGLAYPCFCTRADIAAALSAPHGETTHYPGTCRALPDDPARRRAHPHSWRLDSQKAIAAVGLPCWREQNGRAFQSTDADIDDIILARKDAPAAYHLACVVDDAHSGVTLVVRGADLRASTPVQRVLQMLLGLPEPTYRHHSLVVHADGRRLAKRDQAPTLAAMRATGVDGSVLAQALIQRKLPLGFRLSDA